MRPVCKVTQLFIVLQFAKHFENIKPILEKYFCPRSEPNFTEQLRRKQKKRAGRARDFLLKVVLNFKGC